MTASEKFEAAIQAAMEIVAKTLYSQQDSIRFDISRDKWNVYIRIRKYDSDYVLASISSRNISVKKDDKWKMLVGFDNVDDKTTIRKLSRATTQELIKHLTL